MVREGRTSRTGPGQDWEGQKDRVWLVKGGPVGKAWSGNGGPVGRAWSGNGGPVGRA